MLISAPHTALLPWPQQILVRKHSYLSTHTMTSDKLALVYQNQFLQGVVVVFPDSIFIWKRMKGWSSDARLGQVSTFQWILSASLCTIMY